jgi:HAD superfamily hydrolase (TIGR01509 family)
VTDIAPRPIDAVLFDCDGVLVDSEQITNGVLRGMLHELGWAIEPEECFSLFMGRALQDRAPLILERTGFDMTTEWLLEFRARRDVALAAELEAIPGAAEAARALAAALDGRIACASGADRHKVELQLTKTGMIDDFAGRIFSGMEMPRSKPAPDVYLAAAEALGVDPARCAVVEDSIAGVTAGVAAGATVLGFCPDSPAHSAPEHLLAAGATTTFADMAELPGLIRRLSGR